jgi:hypothetical protein
MKTARALSLVTLVAGLGIVAPLTKPQSITASGTASSMDDSSSSTPTPRPLDLTYHRPSNKTKLRNYEFDTFGPYPVAGAAIVAAVNQANSTPPEWGQGFGAYGERVGSNFGIAMVSTTTRYALAAAFREDTIYYRCECKGLFQRLAHAGISTVTARVGEDGHRRLSFPALIAPYAGTMAAVYGWYPSRYDAKDGLRMGNYNLLAFAGLNVAKEFIYGGPHTLFMRHGLAASSGPDPSGRSTP